MHDTSGEELRNTDASRLLEDTMTQLIIAGMIKHGDDT